MARKNRRDSVDSQIKQKANINSSIHPPGDLTLDSDAERTLWNILTHARDLEAWREMELVLLHKMMRIEMEIRFNRKEMGADYVIDGKQSEHFKIIDILSKQYISIVRTMSLGTAANTAKSVNSGGVKAKEKADHNSRNEKNVVSLIA